DATSSAVRPNAAASVQPACPIATPAAVATPACRPPWSVFRIVSAVSWPGVMITTAEVPRNARSAASMRGAKLDPAPRDLERGPDVRAEEVPADHDGDHKVDERDAAVRL